MAVNRSTENKISAIMSSVFELPQDFFDGARILGFDHAVEEDPQSFSTQKTDKPENDDKSAPRMNALKRLSCNTCSIHLFNSLEEQRAHFKSDFHRFNVKRRLVGRSCITEEEFEKETEKTFSKDDDMSSISGSGEESDNTVSSGSFLDSEHRSLPVSLKRKLLVNLKSGKAVTVWKSLILGDKEEFLVTSSNLSAAECDAKNLTLSEEAMVQRLKLLVQEPQTDKCLRIVLLASGGHFAGCVFSGNKIVAHKTFHRYVVRAKAGGRQSTKDSTGRAPKSAGASLRRYNEMALKKEILELLATWKTYLDSALCIYVFAPSVNGQIFFGGEHPPLNHDGYRVRRIPLLVRRPTLKEAKRIYHNLTSIHETEAIDRQLLVQLEEMDLNPKREKHEKSEEENIKSGLKAEMDVFSNPCSENQIIISTSSDVNTDNVEIINQSTPLHEAAKSGDSARILELLEQGCDPCMKDERGQTPYTLAVDKEVRNVFRRFMAANPDMWDWHAAKVPSALTQEMEDAHAAKQAEKNAKRKARAKEMKKQQKAKEKAQAQAASFEAASLAVRHGQETVSKLLDKGKMVPNMQSQAFQEDLKRIREIEREKRAAAAEKRMKEALAKNSGNIPNSASYNAVSSSSNSSCCSSCGASLSGKVPFHRYDYKYCSTTCMFSHSDAYT